jgi:DNA ligase-1
MVQTSLEVPVVSEEPKKGNRRSGIQLCYPYDEKRLATWKAPYIIQPKLDGVRCRAVIKNREVNLISSEGHLIEHVSHINRELDKTFAHERDSDIELDGELYLHGMNFQDIISRTSRSKNTHADAGKIEYHIFDVITNQSQIDRLALLNKFGFFIKDDCIKVVPSSLVRNADEVMQMYNQYIDKGYEGFVIRDIYGQYVRKRSTGMMKFKPHQTDEYVIVGTHEEVSINGEPKGTLGAFMCVSDGILFNVGTGLTQEQREDLWRERESLVGRKLKVKYQSLTQGKGVPRFPVYLSII